MVAISENRIYWPIYRWKYAIPEDFDVDTRLLENCMGYLKENFPEYKSLYVIKNGFLVFEWTNKDPYEDIDSTLFKGLSYMVSRILSAPAMTFVESRDRCWNMRALTGTVIGILIGIAIEQGYIKGIGQKVSEYLPELFSESIPKVLHELTIEDLLKESSGLQLGKTGFGTLKFILSRGNWLKHILNLPLLELDRVRRRESADAHILSAILTVATGISTEEYAKANLFEPLGIKSLYWEKDRQGINSGFGNLFLSGQDMAKIGFLYLNRGLWDGKQLVSGEWIDKTLGEHFTSGFDNEEIHRGYHWNAREIYNAARETLQIVYTSSESDAQRMYIIPEADTVVAILAGSGRGKPKGRIMDIALKKYIIPAVGAEQESEGNSVK